MTWMNPDAYVEWFCCERCGETVTEDEIFQAEPDYWTCKNCKQEMTDEVD